MDRVGDDVLQELLVSALCGCQTAPPQFCGVSADVLHDMVRELQAWRERFAGRVGWDGASLVVAG